MFCMAPHSVLFDSHQCINIYYLLNAIPEIDITRFLILEVTVFTVEFPYSFV